uniref:Fatty acid desaturase domain-containing protein n=1 Tax=Clastoptera arizonana TaxID=38151 RepID=A0A1B6CSK6_9HEMI
MTAESITEKFSNEDLHLKFESTRETAAPSHVTRYYLGNVVLFAVLHISGLYGLYLLGFTEVKWQTTAFVAALYWMGVIGVTGGNHRLWSHRTYKANLPLRSLLMFFSITSFQGEVFQWARDHRVHHKYQDTDADPYNIRRGFWFAHVGWLLQKKHPLVIEKGKTIDLSDLTKDEVVMFQRKYFWYLLLFFSLFLPTIIPMYFWGESLKTAWYVATSLRIVLCFNTAAIVNSVAHTFGNRPYDRLITDHVGI